MAVRAIARSPGRRGGPESDGLEAPLNSPSQTEPTFGEVGQRPDTSLEDGRPSAATHAAPGVVAAEVGAAKPGRPFALFVRVLLSFGLLFAIFAFVPLDTVGQTLSQIDVSMFAVAVGLTLAGRWLTAFRMSLITARQGLTLTTWELFKIGQMSIYYGFFLPGQVATGAVRWYLIARKDRKGIEAASAIALSRVSDMAILALIGLASAWWTPDDLMHAGVLWTFVGLVTVLIALYAAILMPQATRGLLAVARVLMVLRVPLLRRSLERITRSLARFHFLPFGLQVRLWLLSLLSHGVEAGAIYCLAAALGLDVSFVTCVWLKSFVAFLTMLPISLHGIGLRDGAFVLLLAPFGIAQADAVALSLLALALLLIMAMLGALMVAQEAASLRAGSLRLWPRPGGSP